MFKQVWKQVKQITALSNSTQVITDTDIDINYMQIILPHRKASLHPIHLISQTKGVNITISNCSMEGLRLILNNANISLYIENGTFTAAGINIQSDDNTECLPVHIQSCHFSGHFPEDTLLFNNTDNVSIESCHCTDLQFSNNESSVIKGLNSSFYIDNSVFTNNTGSMSIHGGSSQIINCSFTKSRSCLKAEDTTINISMSQFDGNRDGCIYGHNAVLHIVDSSLTSNIAEQNRVAVNINSSQVTLHNCLLINNIAPLYNPLYLHPWWLHNRAGRWEGDGGAVYAHNSQVVLYSCSLINNTAGAGGGAVRAANSNVTLGNCSLINNTAGRDGGAVYAEDNSYVTLGNCSLINNTARWGGAVYAEDNSYVTLGNCSLVNNTAGAGGGAVRAANSNVTLGNCSLVNNTAEWGGAVGAYDNSCVTLGNCSLINNTARWLGGALSAWHNSHVTLGNCSLINNTAGLDGGAVIAYDNSYVTLGNCSLINNTAGLDGGAVFYVVFYHPLFDDIFFPQSDFKGSVLLTDSDLNSNRAGRDGGAIHIEYAQITMKRCSLSNNQAKQDGGAVNIDIDEIDAENILIDNNFTGNTAMNGGALRVIRRKVTLKGCHMIDNSAKQDGGSIFITDNSKLVIEDSVFTQSSCRKNGGAIMVHLRSTMSLASVKFVNNTAGSGGGAVMILDHSELFDTRSIFMQNLARGFGEYGSTFVTLVG